jgi:hypothetical protein
VAKLVLKKKKSMSTMRINPWSNLSEITNFSLTSYRIAVSLDQLIRLQAWLKYANTAYFASMCFACAKP